MDALADEIVKRIAREVLTILDARAERREKAEKIGVHNTRVLRPSDRAEPV